jgi:protein farnesyltransferase/geranylgeranyltransferase type-1 subunit alpha
MNYKETLINFVVVLLAEMGDRAERSRSSSEEPNGETWIFYKDRPEWRDVTPIPQDDGPNPVVRIAYSDRFKDVYDYFRAVLKSCEKSDRVLQLTADALDLNPANYTVWFYRREVLKALGSDIKKEMKYCREMIEEHPKNYQVWQHRRALIEWAQDPGTELRFTEMILSGDQKNYHAWQHRQWVLHTFNLWQKELDFVQDLIAVDIRNNSAWNQRFFVIKNSEGWTKEVVKREVNFAMDKIKKVVKNESSWNYLRGVLNQCENEELKCELKCEIRRW